MGPFFKVKLAVDWGFEPQYKSHSTCENADSYCQRLPTSPPSMASTATLMSACPMMRESFETSMPSLTHAVAKP